MGPDQLRNALRVRVSRSAGFFLDYLVQGTGRLSLIHAMVAPGRGEVHWQPAAAFEPGPDALAWSDTEWGTLYLSEREAPLFRESQLVVEPVFGCHRGTGAIADVALTTWARPFAESELALLEYADRVDARSAYERALTVACGSSWR